MSKQQDYKMTTGKTATSIHSRLMALAALMMGFNIMASMFTFYYVKCFLDYYHIEESWFQVAQTPYLIWNAVNDPLFAYLQDTAHFRCTRTRRENVLYAAPFFALSFLVPWFPWGDPETMRPWVAGIHLITALCFWDTMFTYVGLAASCLSTEISLEYDNRVKALWYSQIASLAGPLSVFIVQNMSNGLDNFVTFQTCCVVLAVTSCLLMIYCGMHAHTERELTEGEFNSNSLDKHEHVGSYLTLTKQLLTNRDLISLFVVNSFQEMHRTFLYNFLTIFYDQLIPKGAIPESLRNAFKGGNFLVAKIVAILGTTIVQKHGYFPVIRSALRLKVVMGCVLLAIGPGNHWFLMFFLLIDGCTTEAVFSYFNLPLSDITDSDARKYKRKRPITSMICGTNALFVKPAMSVSPMLVVAILNNYGYEQLKRGSLDQGDQDTLKRIMFYMVCMFPLVLGCVQTVAWSFYTIRNSNLKRKALMTGVSANQDEVIEG